MDIRFHGRRPVRDFLPQLMEIDGVQGVALHRIEEDEADDRRG